MGPSFPPAPFLDLGLLSGLWSDTEVPLARKEQVKSGAAAPEPPPFSHTDMGVSLLLPGLR